MAQQPFELLWSNLIIQKPLLANPDSKVEITSENLRKICKWFHSKGPNLDEEQASLDREQAASDFANFGKTGLEDLFRNFDLGDILNRSDEKDEDKK